MLYLQTVAPHLLKIIRAVSAAPFFEQFRLVGGTALSLHLGHRQSVDADFFSSQDFDLDGAIQELSSILPGFLVLKMSTHGFAGIHQGVKIDLYTWGVSFLLPPIQEEGIRLADLPDVASLKLEAIINRKEEKDFRDVHALLQKFTLGELLGFFKDRYPHYSPRMVTDHLLAVRHVERDKSIKLVKEISWEEVESELVGSVRQFYEEKARLLKAKEENELKHRLEEIKKRNKRK